MIHEIGMFLLIISLYFVFYLLFVCSILYWVAYPDVFLVYYVFIVYSQCLKNLKIEIYGTVIFLVVLHGYETWSVTLKEEHRLTLFKNWVVRKIPGAKREEGQKLEKITYFVT